MIGRTVTAVAAIVVATRCVRRRRHRLVLAVLLLWLLQKLLQRHQRRLLRAYLIAIGERPGAIGAAKQLQRASTGIAERAVSAVATLRRQASLKRVRTAGGTDSSAADPVDDGGIEGGAAPAAGTPGASTGGRAAGSEPGKLLLQVTLSQLTARNVKPPEQGLWKTVTDLPLKLFWGVEVRADPLPAPASTLRPRALQAAPLDFPLHAPRRPPAPRSSGTCLVHMKTYLK
eukprot:scaffold28581_cov94-Isochrysis_galbana.AAC.2